MSVPIVERESQRYWDDKHWASEHSTELHRRFGIDSPHGGSIWIAIYNKEVVAWGPNLAEVEKKATEKTGVDTREIFVKFIENAAAIYDQPAL